MPKRRNPIFAASALGFIAVCVIVIVAWEILPGVRSQTLAPQDQVSAEELPAAIEVRRRSAAELSRSATFFRQYFVVLLKSRSYGRDLGQGA